jgi:hypothetical protein
MQATSYFVSEYNADGHSEPVRSASVGTLKEARALVREWLGRKRLHPSLKWRGEDSDDGQLESVEAYHAYGRTHPMAYGCGGVAIARRAGIEEDK